MSQSVIIPELFTTSKCQLVHFFLSLSLVCLLFFSHGWVRMCFLGYKCSRHCNYHWLLRICQTWLNHYITKVLFNIAIRRLTGILLKSLICAQFLTSWGNAVTVYLKYWLFISSYCMSSADQIHETDLRRMSKVKYFLWGKLSDYFWPQEQALSWGCAGGKECFGINVALKL